MIPSPNPCTGSGTSDNSLSKTDPFIATPPRKPVAKHPESPTPKTPRSKSTPLRQRFLDEVTMSPGTSSTPPRTPSQSPTRGAGGVKAATGLLSQTPKPMLEVGQNGFYFSMEIPEKKITPRRAATPDAKGAGRVTPSPEKQKRSEVKTGGRVRDILRKNLFGTPTKQVARSAAQGREDGVRTLGKCGVQTQAGESAVTDVSEKDATGASITLVASLETATALSSPALPSPITESGTTQPPPTSSMQQRTPQPPSATFAPTKDTTLGPRKAPAASTPFNIGQLMANHSSSKTSKTQPLPASGLESMPTPLRKMSERLGLRSPNVVRKDTTNLGGEKSIVVTPAQELVPQSPLSRLDFQTNAAVMHGAAAIPLPSSLPPSPSPQTSTTQMEPRLQTNYPISPIISSPHPHTTADNPSLPSPATPSRPHHPLRTQSFGTPLRLRSSMQSEMLRVQESLKRSLGPDVFQAVSSSSRPGTPPSFFETTAPSPLATRSSNSTPTPTPQPRSATLGRKTPRPVSMLGGAPAKAEDAPGVAVSRTTTATRASKSRPKSMIVGSARVLETIASHTKGPPLDSPRERAKQRSMAGAGADAAEPTRGIGVGREAIRNKSDGGAASTAPEPEAKAEGRAKTPKPQPVVRTTKAAALRAAQHSKVPLSNPPNARPTGPRPTVSRPRPKSQIFCQPAAPPTASPATDPKPKTEKGMGALGRAKSVKAVASGPVSKTTTTALGRAKSVKAVAPGAASSKAATVAPKREVRKERRELKTPEPQSRDLRADSGTGGRYAEECCTESFTPPGGPTRLPSPIKSPSKTRLDVCGGRTPPPPPAPVFNAVNPASQPLSKKYKQGAQRISSDHTPPRRVLSGPRIPPAALQIATTPAARHFLLDANALRSPSKEIQNSLDAAIDRKIAEDRARVTELELAGWL
ncbi:hypothetical protein E8E13_006501 [Curvularia kusanoi]|uniref:Uncharacterized protein n=1 Tax=Curvularia kusanoi TaxID=90978 RepID=A0A9P4T8Z3_CURKU|nr:hypothetical protein E8E13_006501 [Curvularia kusanoi]